MFKSYEEFYGNANKKFKYPETESQNSSVLNPSETSISSIDDTNRSNTSSPCTPPQNSTPFTSITNRAINKQTGYTTVSQHNYYHNSIGYENYHFQPYLMPQFHPHPHPHPHQQQYQFLPPAQHNPLRLHRSSISSNTDTSSASLNSPSQFDENSPPVINQTNLAHLGNQEFNGYKNNQVETNSTGMMVRGKSEQSINDSDDQLPLKKRRPVPTEHKDQSYWEKRRKNNESAKRSRDMRRCKEEHISIRVVCLEQENLQLRTEIGLLRNDSEKLRAILYANNLNPITGMPNNPMTAGRS